MSRWPKSPKFKRFRSDQIKRRIAPITVALLFAVLGPLLIFFSMAQDEDDPPPYVAPNPAISAQACLGGLNIALVADVSGSIVKQPEGFQQMQDAYKDFVSALLPSTLAQFSVTEFGNNGRVLQPFTTNVTALVNAIDGFTKDEGAGTNWPDGLQTGYNTFSGTSSSVPRLLVIATDGNPSVRGRDSDDVLMDSIQVANQIKQAGVHILVIGIEGDDGRPDVANMVLISGSRVNTGGVNADVITADFDNMSAALQDIATSSCVSNPPPPPPSPPPSGTGGFGTGTGTGGVGTGTGGFGTGTGGTGTGTGGFGTGTGGFGTGSNGAGTGTSGTGTGTSTGRSPQPSPTPTPTAPQGVQPSPAPTNTPNQQPTPAPVATQTTEPTPTPSPTPTAQGARTVPPEEQPSPFYDGKEYAPGSTPDNFDTSAKRRTSPVWLYGIAAAVIILPAAGLLLWRKYKAPATPGKLQAPGKKKATKKK